MIGYFVGYCIKNGWLIIAIFVMMALFGWYSFTQLAVEAYPDIADVTSQVISQWPGHAAEEVEQQVTVPLERELNGIPGLHVMRSNSTFALSLITLVFNDGVDDYWSRERIQERINNATVPSGVQPGLDSLTSPIGEIYRYTLKSKFRNERELRDLQDWVVIPQFKQAYGVIDVDNFGGEVTQFQLALDPMKMAAYGISLQQINQAIQSNNTNAGGSTIDFGEQSFVVRGIGLIQNLDDLGNILINTKQGTPVYLHDLGTLRLGALQRSGILGIYDNEGDNPDAVEGIVDLLKHENPSRTLVNVHKKVEELNAKILPPDVKVVPYLDRTELINTTLRRVGTTLSEGMILVVIVLILFLGSLRGALLVAVTIPFAMLFAFILMNLTGIPANLLSLGAIDFGILVDGAIVLMETILRRHENHPNEPVTDVEAIEAANQVSRPIFFATLIIITAYLPLLAFQRVEGKLFAPMAYTVSYALGGALLCALALIPVLAFFAFRKPSRPIYNPVLRWITTSYDNALQVIVKAPMLAIIPGVIAGVLALVLGAFLGREFLPYLDEGSLWLQINLPTGISMEKASQMATDFRKVVHGFPEVSYVVTQLGRNDDQTDPFTPSHIESCIGLKPYDQWGGDKQALIKRMSDRFKEMPGFDIGFSQPMIDGVNDKLAGGHSELVIRIFGNDLTGDRSLAEQIKGIVEKIPGATDVDIDQLPPLPQLQIKINRLAAARYGINMSDISDLVQLAVGGEAVSQLLLNDRTYDITCRFIDSVRNSPEAIGNLTLTSSTGAQIPLSQLADIKLASGESTITHENCRRMLTVKMNLRGRALSSFLAEAQKALDDNIKYNPTDYQIVWGGLFENQQRAQDRLALILPMVIGLIFLWLYASFKNLSQALLILINIPLALLGGVIALHLRSMSLNVSSAVGFIALFGVAVQNGVIMVANLNRWRDTTTDLAYAVRMGAIERLRPVLMTATVATLGLLPAALARGVGSDVQRPLATVVVGGLTSATILTLFVLPALYFVLENYVARRRRKTEAVQVATPSQPEH